MVQFKDVFLGKETRDYSRAASAQRCVRAGGKHNDLENVGYTARHHTFFEMLGNFSFGDYFKREAIHFAWNFVTGTLGYSQGPSVGHGLHGGRGSGTHLDRGDRHRSDSLHAAWARNPIFGPWGRRVLAVRAPRFSMIMARRFPAGRPGSPDEDGDRYVEIWNLVFMQYDRSSDGVLVPLPKPSVDTGMGLERVAAVMQGVHSNYDIDLFKSLIRRCGRESPAPRISSPRVCA